YEQRFNDAMGDDFNTPVAVAALFDLARDINRLRAVEPARAAALGALLCRLGGVLGLLARDPESYLKRSLPTITATANITQAGDTVSATIVDGLSDSQIDQLIEQRATARKTKNWAESDRIRDALKSQGVILEDAAGVTTWRRE
ncbi:MAG: DALR domain-containing protein, partial [Pseudomonadota bacterium]